jgi:hypothetical protein
MGDLSLSAVLSKAAVMGVVYGLGRLAGFAAGRGMDLLNLSSYLDQSTDSIQRWELAFAKAGITADETHSVLKNVQNIMGAMRRGEAAPKGWDRLASEAGLNFYDRHEKILEKTMKWLRTTKMDAAQANSLAASMGLSENTISMARRMDLALDKVNGKRIQSKKLLQEEADIKVKWEALWDSMQKKMQEFAVMYAGPGIKHLGHAFDWVVKVTDNLSKLMDKFKAFDLVVKGLGIAIAAYFAPITAAVVGLVYLLSKYEQYNESEENKMSPEDKKLSTEQPWQYNLQSMFRGTKEFGGLVGKGASSVFDMVKDVMPKSNVPSTESLIYSGSKLGQAPTNPNINVQQTLNFQHEGKDASKTASSVNEAVKRTFYQMPALSGGH